MAYVMVYVAGRLTPLGEYKKNKKLKTQQNLNVRVPRPSAPQSSRAQEGSGLAG
jgi:hypothetical protein